MPRMRWRPVRRPGPRWGSSRRSPRSPSRLGRGGGGHPLVDEDTPSPRTPRLSAPRSSRFQRSALAARRHVSSVYPPKFWQYTTNWFYSNFA